MSSLTVFEAAARHESFTRAAQQLSMTESAVSRQIRQLEDQLGLKLFSRVQRRVVLTTAGRQYSAHMHAALERIRDDTLALMAYRGEAGRLELSASPTFASEWLIPRLGAFYERHPGMTVNFGAQTRMFLFEGSGFDAAIYFGEPTWPGTIADRLFDEDLVAVCHPALLRGRTRAARLAALREEPLLHSATRPQDWNNWCAAARVDAGNEMRGPRFELHSMVISAALARQGIALLPKFLIQTLLDEGKLVVAHEHIVRNEGAYYLAYPEGMQSSPPLSAFRVWILEHTQLLRASA